MLYQLQNIQKVVMTTEQSTERWLMVTLPNRCVSASHTGMDATLHNAHRINTGTPHNPIVQRNITCCISDSDSMGTDRRKPICTHDTKLRVSPV